MQVLTAPPRDSLTEDQVRGLLLGDSLTVTAGAELLNADLTLRGDISDDLAAATVNRDMAADVHGDFRVQISRELDWATDLLQLYMLLSDDTGLTARFNVGVVVFTTPQTAPGDAPVTFDVQGYDRLYLLSRPVGDSYAVTAGTDVLTAVRTAFAAAGLSGVLLDGSATGKTLPSDMVWPLVPSDAEPATWLRVINDLLATVGYRGIWADELGRYRSEPYAAPSSRASEFTFDVDDTDVVIVGAARTVTRDQWNRPNRWVFVQQNLPGAAPVEGAGVYTVDHSGSSLAWVKQVSLDVADQASLVARGDQTVAEDSQSSVSLDVTTGPFPLAGHYDVFTYRDSAVPDVDKVQATRWSMSLDGSDMTWTWEAVAT